MVSQLDKNQTQGVRHCNCCQILEKWEMVYKHALHCEMTIEQKKKKIAI